MDKTSKTKNLGEFTVHLRPLAEKFKKQQFWQETIDLDQKDPIFHNDEEVDVRHVRTNTHDYIGKCSVLFLKLSLKLVPK